MARLNLVENPSFRQGLANWNAINGASLSITTSQAFYGNESLVVTKDDQNSSGVQTDYIAVQGNKNYAFSSYVRVPVTVPAMENCNLVLKVTWYNTLNQTLGDSTSQVDIVRPGDGWVRLTGVTVAPATAVTARLSITQLAAGSEGETFLVDATLFEQADFVGGYLDNVSQAEEDKSVNTGLTPLPAPTVGGMQLEADIILGDLVLNTIDENNIVWVCTDIDGWWGQSTPEIPDIPRGVEDGSYDVTGRYQARVMTLSGTFLLPDPSLLGKARDILVTATNLVRKGAWLRTNENPTRAAFVRLSGKPQIKTVNARGRTDFAITLKAADPIRYEWNDQDPDGITTIAVGEDTLGGPVINLATNPGFETASLGVPVGVTPTSATATQATSWRDPLSYALAITPNASTPASRATIATQNTGALAKLIPGQSYTVAATCYLSAPLTGTLYQYSRQITATVTGSGGGDFVSAKAPNATGETRLSVSFTVPADSTSTFVQLWNGASNGGGTVYWDDVVITQITSPSTPYTGPAFSGNTVEANFTNLWLGTPNAAPSVRIPGLAASTVARNIGTADVTAVFELEGPLGSGSTVTNIATGETITTTEELRGVGATATITNKQLLNGIATLTTANPHSLLVGDQIVVSGVGSPFDAINETLTVLAVTTTFPYTFSYARATADIDSTAVAGGQVALANNDMLSLDTYNRSVVFNGNQLGNRSRVETLVDWIKLAPGDNPISFTDTPTERQITTKALAADEATITTSDSHFFQPGEYVIIDMPTVATLAKKSLTNNVVTITTAKNHGYAVGDQVTIASVEASTISNKALTSNVATLTTLALGAFAVGDTISVSLPTTRSVSAKGVTSNIATITTSVAHGFSVGDAVTIALNTTANVTNKSLANNTATLTTSTAHGFSAGDTMTVALSTSTTVTQKYRSGSSVILTTAAAHNFSVGDQITVAFPASATLTESRVFGGSAGGYLVTVNTTAAHNFSIGDAITVATGQSSTAAITTRAATTTVATITTAAAHGFAVGETVTVTGLAPQYNSTWTITAVTSTTFQFAGSFTAEGATADDGVATNITIRDGYNGTKIIETIPNSTSFTYLWYGQVAASTNTTSTGGLGAVTNNTNTQLNGTYAITSVPTSTQLTYTRS